MNIELAEIPTGKSDRGSKYQDIFKKLDEVGANSAIMITDIPSTDQPSVRTAVYNHYVRRSSTYTVKSRIRDGNIIIWLSPKRAKS